MTLRQAMSLLDREGLINSRRGIGTVREAPVGCEKQHQDFRSFSEEIESAAERPESRLISFELTIPTTSVRDFFELRDAKRYTKFSVCA